MSWPLVQLEEICEINIGKTPSRSNSSYWGGEEPWLSISDMNQGKTFFQTKEKITFKAIKECNMKIVVPGTVLFSFKLSIGKVGRTSIPMYTNEAIASLPIKNANLIDPKYLMYYLKEIAPNLTGDRAVMGATLNKQKLKEIKISLPPLNEQRRIAKILDSVDSLKNKTITKDKIIEKLINSHFLKEVEKTNCENIKLGNFINFLTSGGRGWSKYFAEDGEYFIRVADVINETIKTDNPQFVIPPNNAEAKRTKTEEGDVVLSITGSVGRAAVVTKKHINSFISQHIALIRLDKNFLIPDYLVLLLSMEKFGQNQIKKYQYGQTKPGLNFEQISNFVFPIPPIKIQKKILEEINLIRKLKIKNLSKAQKIEELNKAIQEEISK